VERALAEGWAAAPGLEEAGDAGGEAALAGAHGTKDDSSRGMQASTTGYLVDVVNPGTVRQRLFVPNDCMLGPGAVCLLSLGSKLTRHPMTPYGASCSRLLVRCDSAPAGICVDGGAQHGREEHLASAVRPGHHHGSGV
jgi:hypothetical protein